MEDFLHSWGYTGIFLGLIATGMGFPMPEELPVIIGGALAGGHGQIHWYIMLPVCIIGVIIGDGVLYAIGRLWGPRLLSYRWINKRLLPPGRLATIEKNFQEYGIKLLLFARLTPGIRGAVFFTAGLTKLSLARFLLADGIYAIPGVSLLFFLGYWFADSVKDLTNGLAQVKSIIVIIVIVGVAGYFTYRALRKPVVTGDPHEIPPLVESMTHTLEHMTSKIILSKAARQALETGHNPPSAPSDNGQPETAASPGQEKQSKNPAPPS